MEERQALSAFAALSQDTRLRVLRLLVVAGPEGSAAGVVADGVGVSASNVSFHLKELERSGLITSRRESRSIIYSANFDALNALVRFLMEDCCAGRIGACEPLPPTANAPCVDTGHCVTTPA